MNITNWARRLGALAFLAAIAAILTGCSGSGGGATTAAQVIQDNGTFGGTLSDNVAGRGNGGGGGTSCTLRIDGTTGAASFRNGTFGDAGFVSYSADITNVEVTPGPSGDLTGIIQFDMVNFTSASPFANLHWDGNYEWNHVHGQGAALNITGTVTGTDRNGGSVNLPFTLNYAFFPHVVNYTGAWSGEIDIPGSGATPWTGNFSRIDDTHTTVAINYGGGVITIPAVTTNISLAGQFDGSQFLPGAVGHFYVERDPEFHDDDHFIGGYTVTFGGTVFAAGTIRGVKGGTSGGATLSTGYYQGSLTPSGGVQHSLSIDLLHTSANVGVQGAVSMNPSSVQPVIGARIATAMSSNGTATVTLSNFGLTQIAPSFAGRYSTMTLTGTPSASGFSGNYTASLSTGGTETGTFTTNKLSNVPHFNLAGSWSGTASGNNGAGSPNPFSGTIVQTEDEFTFTATQSVSGQNVTFSVNGYVVGNTFVGNVVNQNVTVFGIPGTITGHFEGVVASNGQQITGEFAYTATATGIGSTSDKGTFTLTKQ